MRLGWYHHPNKCGTNDLYRFIIAIINARGLILQSPIPCIETNTTQIISRKPPPQSSISRACFRTPEKIIPFPKTMLGQLGQKYAEKVRRENNLRHLEKIEEGDCKKENNNAIRNLKAFMPTNN